MTNRVQMDDIQYRLEIIKQQLLTGSVENGKLQELIDDCARLRHADPSGQYTDALVFIETMLGLVMKNLTSTRALRALSDRLCG